MWPPPALSSHHHWAHHPVLPVGPAQTKQEEDLTEALENEETLQVTVRPKQSFFVWQYLLSLGQEPVLLCHDPT
ncbi:hypothetical protein DR999_PMT20467 [Platysternon megacephalum]|uniref:Uncharacterized protein n=1 Tax=Platysternon megacephalum TaxID=55544 RepID=A0A4D9DQH9_9SAUR|nr:hypothetical protein DR999_PMT20467 [Platysternon megacephalum]